MRVAYCSASLGCDHDHKAVFGHLLQQLHHRMLRRCPAASRLVGQAGYRVVDQCAGNGHTLHLAADDFAGVFVQQAGRPDLPAPAPCGLAAALGTGNAGDGQRQLHIGKHCLVRDEVIALEHSLVVKAVSPSRGRYIFGGDVVDDRSSAVVAIQTANDVQQGGLPEPLGPRMATNSLSRRFRLTSSSAFCTRSPVLYSS